MSRELFSQLLYEEIVGCVAKRQSGFDKVYFAILMELRRQLVMKGDPLISMVVGKQPLKMNISHNLPLYRALYPTYDTALSRLAQAIYDKEGYLKVIDVGANIGDSAALISQTVTGDFLCVEGEPRYYSLLRENATAIAGQVVCVNAVCAEEDCQLAGGIKAQDGTGHFTGGEAVERSVLMSLATILEGNPGFGDANLLKVDTDGFDCRVLRGARQVLAERGMTVFFEYSPALLLQNGEQPEQIFPFLVSLGYRQGLFYDNYGVPLAVADIGDERAVREMSERIDYNSIGYFDILLPGRGLGQGWFELFCQREFLAVQALLNGN